MDSSEFVKHALYSVSDCPVCADSGAVLLLKAYGSGQTVFVCPLCGVAWREPPLDGRIDEIATLESLAPDGVTVPTSAEALSTGLTLTEVPFDRWFSFLKGELRK